MRSNKRSRSCQVPAARRIVDDVDIFGVSEAPEKDEKEGASERDAPALLQGPVLEASASPAKLVARIEITEEQALAIENYEQGTNEWGIARRGSQTRLPDGSFYSERASAEPGFTFIPGRLTASNFGTAVKHNAYATPEQLIQDMLWGVVRQNEAMRYGSEMEDVACDVFETALYMLSGGNLCVDHKGLMLSCPGLRRERPDGTVYYEGWCGTSPDGLVRFPSSQPGTTHLLEIKCPSMNKRNFYSERAKNERFGIPWYYYDQIMGICGLQHLPESYFVVHLPDRTQVLKFVFNAPYFMMLYDGMRKFWFEQYLPAAVLCAQGRLLVGDVDERTMQLQVDMSGEVHRADVTLQEDIGSSVSGVSSVI